MIWMAALALAALNTQVSQKNEISCDLAPYAGGGSSSEGNLDSLNGLGMGCHMILYDGGDWTAGPRLEFNEQRWTVFREARESTSLHSYQARTFGLGLNLGYDLAEQWKLGYAFGYAMGQGSQNQNTSTPTSTQNLELSNMTQRAMRHEISVTRRINDRLSFLAAMQWDQATQTWDSASGRLERENVTAGNRLTLASGTGAELEGPLTQKASYKALSLKIGVQLKIYSSL